MSSIEDKIGKGIELIQRPENQHLISRGGPKNIDPLLVPVQIVNLMDVPIEILRDRRFDAYVKHWRRHLAPLRYMLGPNKKVILPNEYVIYKTTDGRPVKINKRYGPAMRD